MKIGMMTTVSGCETRPRMPSDLHKLSCFTDNRPATCSFSIESILGLEKKRDFTLAGSKHYRPWMDNYYTRGEIDTRCWQLPIISYEIPLQVHTVRPSLDKESTVQYDKCCSTTEHLTYKRELSWYRGRRPRTAFTRSQIEVLENVFQLNSYPGIDVREELANKLSLDEDRIQKKSLRLIPCNKTITFRRTLCTNGGTRNVPKDIFDEKLAKPIWFQNRRAKLKRCHRESQFLIVKETLTPQIKE